MDKTLEARLGACASLPTMPAVALKVLELCREPEPNLDEIAKVLSADPALSAKLLRVVNSAVFSLRQEIRTVRHAITMLGLISVRTLALSFSLAQGLKKNQQVAFKTYWKRSALAATAARELTTVLKLRNGDELFLAALLQDMGVLALGQLATKKFENLNKGTDDHSAIIQHERREFSCDHAEAGAWLAGRWKLPPVFVESIKWSHDPMGMPPDTDADEARFVRIVALAGLIADIYIHPDTGEATATARSMAESLLGLDKKQLEDVLTAVNAKGAEIAQFLDVPIGTKAELDAVLDQAKETLVMVSLQATQQAAKVQRTVNTLEARTRELEAVAQRDALTGLANRGHLEAFLDDSFVAALNAGGQLSIIVVDLDKFKSINDTYGHLGGDKVLKEAAALLGKSIRPRDCAGRYGGEEFVLVLPDTPAAGARVVAERVRHKLESTPIELEAGKVIRVTASFGCASLDPDIHVTKKDLIGAADRALYAAKHAGRNRVVSADEMNANGEVVGAAPARAV